MFTPKWLTILEEIEQHKMELQFDDLFDPNNIEEDWITYFCAYASRKIDEKNKTFRETMLKIAALAVAAVEAYDKEKR